MKLRFPSLRAALGGTVLASTMLVAGCAMPTPYRPAIAANGVYQTGYSDYKIEDNRYRVMFSGNDVTSRETVERYLLYRAAELTVQQGYDYFILADRHTDKKSQSYIDSPDPFGGPYGGGFGFGYGYWNPYWRFYNPGIGWGGWGGFGGPFGGDADIHTVDRYQAMAEIVVGKGQKPDRNLHAFDAREVLQNLGPHIMAPQRR